MPDDAGGGQAGAPPETDDGGSPALDGSAPDETNPDPDDSLPDPHDDDAWEQL